VEGFYKSIKNPANLAIALVGDVDPSVWERRMNQMIKAFGQANAQDWPPVESFSLNEHRIVRTEQKKEQAHLCYAVPGLRLDDKRRSVLDVMQTVLSGQGGRLFIELRDKASLAYSVSPIRMDGLDGGYFGAYIGCSPEKTEKALRMMKEEFDKLVQTPLRDDELQLAKNQLIGRHDIGLQKNSSVASEMVMNEVYGLPFDEYMRAKELYQSVSASAVQNLAQELFAGKTVTSIVGPNLN